MDLNIDVYLTTKNDSLDDLRVFRDESGFYKWKSNVKGVAFQSTSFKGLSSDILKDATQHTILEAFGVIEYPPGAVFEADDEIGEKIKALFREQGIGFNYNLTRDEQALPDTFKVSIDIVVDKD